MPTAYCVKCKAKKEIQNPKSTAKAISGVCPTCGTSVHTFKKRDTSGAAAKEPKEPKKPAAKRSFTKKPAAKKSKVEDLEGVLPARSKKDIKKDAANATEKKENAKLMRALRKVIPSKFNAEH